MMTKYKPVSANNHVWIFGVFILEFKKLEENNIMNIPDSAPNRGVNWLNFGKSLQMYWIPKPLNMAKRSPVQAIKREKYKMDKLFAMEKIAKAISDD